MEFIYIKSLCPWESVPGFLWFSQFLQIHLNRKPDFSDWYRATLLDWFNLNANSRKLKQQTCLLVWWLPQHSHLFTSSKYFCSYWERQEKVLAKVDAKTCNMKVILKDHKKKIIQQMPHFTRRREFIFCVELFFM